MHINIFQLLVFHFSGNFRKIACIELLENGHADILLSYAFL